MTSQHTPRRPAANLPGPSDSAGVPADKDETVVTTAAVALRAQSHARALEIAPAVLAHVFAQPRRSMPVRARDDIDYLRVSEKVIASILTRRVETEVAGAALRAIAFRVNRDDHLDEVNIELIGQYGHYLVQAAEKVRAAVSDELHRLIGTNSPAVNVTTTTNLHFGDVTVGDPHLHDPAD